MWVWFIVVQLWRTHCLHCTGKNSEKILWKCSQNLSFSLKYVKISNFSLKSADYQPIWKKILLLFTNFGEKDKFWEKCSHLFSKCAYSNWTQSNTWQLKHSHSTGCNKYNALSVSEEWSYLLWKSIFPKEFIRQLHCLNGVVPLMLASFLNIDFQRRYDNFSETPDSLFLLHHVQQPKSTHCECHHVCGYTEGRTYGEGAHKEQSLCKAQATYVPPISKNSL